MSTALQLYVKAITALTVRAREERGQGTVEYVGIIFIVAAIVLAVAAAATGFAADIMNAIGDAIKGAIAKASGS